MLRITQVNRLSETTRVTRQLWSHEDDGKGVFMVMFGRRWTFTPELYSRAALDFPMILTSSVVNVGRTSMDMCSTIEDESDGKELASLVFRVVNVDPVTRQTSVPFPELARKSMAKFETESTKKFEKLSVPLNQPDKKYKCKIAVRFDDMDFLMHANQGAYIKFCMECAAQASTSGFYSKFSTDIAFYRPSRYAGLHLAESEAGDELEVSTWEDPENPLLLHFVIGRDEKNIFYAHIEFFPE